MKKTNRLKVSFFVSFIAAIMLSGFVGYLIGNKNISLGPNYVPQIVKRDLGRPRDVNFDLFWEAYSKIKASYLGDIDSEKYLYGAIAGAFGSTGDPYTAFLPPQISKEFQNELSGELEGIGIRIGVLDGIPAVIAALRGSPAEGAGLKPRDKIVKVGDTETVDLSLDEVVSKIRGSENTTVKIEVIRGSEDKVRTFEIKRAKLEVKTVELKFDSDVAIIELNEFGVNTREDFIKAAQEISSKNINKVVLDLRNNPGGLLDGAIDVAGELFPKGTTVVFEDSKTGKNEEKTSAGGLLKQVNLVVLVNGGSASASEILAGAIKDNKRGKIIGEKTFGKGTVQQLESLSNGSSVKITVAKWLTPSGLSIDKNGINPDIEVKEGENALFSEDDAILKRALQEIRK